MKTLGWIAVFFLSSRWVFAQCACTGGAAVGGLTPVGGTVNVGVLREGYGRASVGYRYSAGATTLRGDLRTESGTIRSHRTHYVSFLLGYGLTNALTLEAEGGYFPRKVQDFGYTKATGSGASHCLTGVKYNIYSRITREIEVTVGAGLKIPLGSADSTLPQHILPSSGAFGLALQAFLHKGWKQLGLRLFLLHRSELNAENTIAYRYGAGHFTSLIVGKSLAGSFTAFLELRHEFRRPDMYHGMRLEDTGGSIFLLSPQVNVILGNLNVSVLVDYPVYRYYNGTQLANDYSIAAVFTWQGDILGE